jgi:hypothetical protein
MSIFGDIWNKLTGSAEAQTVQPENPVPADAPQTDAPPVENTTPATSISEVDVENILSTLENQKGVNSNWRTSIVDLLKLLDLDSSIAARKELADEIGVRVGADGSAEQNVALHKAVMAKLEENGGKVPDSLKG